AEPHRAGDTPKPADPPRAASAATVLYHFTAADQKPFYERRRGKDVLEQSGTGRAPQGWSTVIYKPESTGEYMIQTVGGRAGFGLRCVEGEAAVQITSSFEERIRGLPAGGSYLVRFRFFGEEAARGDALVRVKGYKSIAKAELRPTGGQWK